MKLEPHERAIADAYDKTVKGLSPLLTDTMRRAFLDSEVMHAAILSVASGRPESLQFFVALRIKLREHYQL